MKKSFKPEATLILQNCRLALLQSHYVMASAASVSMLLATGALQAQTEDAAAAPVARAQAVEEVVITGTRIRGAEAVGSNVVAISPKDVAETGLTTTTDLLRSVPQVSNLGADDTRTNGAQRAISNIFASSAVNLRGLGVEATLELVDGKRPVRSGEGRFFNTDSIPAIALQRIEVVPDGASAIYGSDAVTGVVNLVPYHSFDGALVRANYGSADDLHQYTFSILGGRSWDNGGVVLSFEHSKRSHLRATDRPDLYNDSVTTTGAIGTSTNASPGNINVAGAPRPILDVNNDGRLSAAEYAAGLASSNANRQSNWLGVDARPEQKRNSFFAYGDQEITDRLKFYGEGFYSKRDFVRLNAPASGTLSVPASNFYNQSGVPAPLSVLYSYINDFGSTRAIGYEKSRQVTAGLKFDLGNEWQTEGFYSDGNTDNFSRSNNQINNTALNAALANNTAAAFDPFNSSFNQQATLNSISGYSTNATTVKLKNGGLKADGPVVSLPGGDVRVAAGLEYLKESRASIISNTSAGADVNTLVVAQQATVTRKVDSAYAEMLIPIFGPKNALPGIRRLTLSLAGRRDSYSDGVPGNTLLDTSTSNPKFGVTWQPVEDFKVRGSYGKSFRAPSLGDYAFGAPTFIAAGPAAAVGHAPGLFGLPNGPVAALLNQGGRLDGVLTPEKAKSWSLGVDFAPTSVPGLNLSATYYKIEYKNQIQTPATAGSFSNVDYANSLVAAGLAVANPTTAQVLQYYDLGGSLTPRTGSPRAVLYGSGSAPALGQTVPIYLIIDSRSVNSGLVKTSGWDFSARYSLSTALGKWLFSDTLTYVADFRQSLVSGSPLVGLLNTYGYPVRLNTRAQIGWELNGASANLFANYGNSYTNTQVTPNVAIASNTTFDLTVGYDMGPRPGSYGLDNLSFQISALNLFDRRPPYALVNVPPTQTFDTQNATATGRLISLNIQKRW